jgi:aldehyde dehydrogenase (NAD+)
MAEVRRESMRIAGEHVGSERVIEVENPWTGAVVGTVPRATPADVRRAFAAARRSARRCPATSAP